MPLRTNVRITSCLAMTSDANTLLKQSLSSVRVCWKYFSYIVRVINDLTSRFIN